MRTLSLTIGCALFMLVVACNGAQPRIPSTRTEPALASNTPVGSVWNWREIEHGNWKGIRIGNSTESDAQEIFGEPSRVYQTYDGGVGYEYSNSDRPVWMIDFRSGIVDQITVDLVSIKTASGPEHMVDLADLLGQPEIVSWSSLEGARTLVWPNNGIAATVFVESIKVESPYNWVRVLKLFPRMDRSVYETTIYYFGLIPKDNPFAETPELPEDPFDWQGYFQTRNE